MPPDAIPVREQPLAPGDTAPDFELSDSTATRQRLFELCASNPLVLLFYRGHW